MSASWNFKYIFLYWKFDYTIFIFAIAHQTKKIIKNIWAFYQFKLYLRIIY